MCCVLQRISAYDRLTNAVREVVPDVMNTAAARDVQLAAHMANGSDLPLLFCVPILIKDNYDARDGECHLIELHRHACNTTPACMSTTAISCDMLQQPISTCLWPPSHRQPAKATSLYLLYAMGHEMYHNKVKRTQRCFCTLYQDVLCYNWLARLVSPDQQMCCKKPDYLVSDGVY